MRVYFLGVTATILAREDVLAAAPEVDVTDDGLDAADQPIKNARW